MPRLENTTALITGGGRGLGRAISIRLAAEGADVIIHYNRNLAAAEETAGQIQAKVTLVQADLSSPADVDRMFRDLAARPLDFLINNAGVWKPSLLGSTTEEALAEILDTNIKGPFRVAQRALPLLREGGRIINISSVAGRIASSSGRSMYGATKAALDALTRNWALELAPRRILVNAVAPGYVATDMTADFFADPKNLERAMSRHPLGWMTAPEDIAGMVAFLCSSDARSITGQSFNVSGGSVI